MKDKPVILVVDDQPQNIELLEAYLVPQGFEIVKAATGAKSAGETFWLSNRSDSAGRNMMSGIDGFEVTRRVIWSSKNDTQLSDFWQSKITLKNIWSFVS